MSFPRITFPDSDNVPQRLCIKNVSRNLNITENKARDIINKTDKQRASYYNYYTSKKWGDSKSYNLSLDAGKLGTDNCVEMILKFRELMDAMK